MLLDFGTVVGMGKDRPDFWLAPAKDEPRRAATSPSAPSRSTRSSASTRRRLEAGGTDNGGPGLRPHYHQNYYGAFALDPDGNNAEAVYHGAMQP